MIPSRFPYALLVLPFLAGCASEPPTPTFSHAKHVVENQIACVYCHPHAEKSPVAGLPSVKKCMDCHSFLSARSAQLQPLFDAWETQRPMEWIKHNDLPDHVVFSHQAHLRSSLTCNDCHGDVEHDQLRRPLRMKHCLECHKQREAPRNCATCHK